jgi:hypothetical protein
MTNLFQDYTNQVLSKVQQQYNFTFSEKQIAIINSDMLLHLGFNKQLYVDAASNKEVDEVLLMFGENWLKPTLIKLDRTLQFSK